MSDVVGSAMSDVVNTKQSFFKERSVHIIIALVVIITIMVGIGVGIYEFVKTIQNPCVNQQGTILDKNTNKCIQSSCPNTGSYVCKNPNEKTWYGKCIPPNYCTDPYVYDEDSCQCTLKCNDGYVPFGTRDNVKNATTPMYTINEGNTYEPMQDLVCGATCEYATKPYDGIYIRGGKNFCVEGSLCAQNIIDANPPINNYEGQCLDPSSFKLCPSPNGNTNACNPRSDCTTIGDEQRCVFKQCGYNNDRKAIPCQVSKNNNDNKNPDCYYNGQIDGDATFTCKRTEDMLTKEFKDVGYCSGTNINNQDMSCVHKDLIGENFDSTPGICTNNQKGVTLTVQQCKDAVNGPCAIDTICDNGWQAKLDSQSMNTNCQSSFTEATSSQRYLPSGKCCNDENIAIGPNGKPFCCGAPTVEVGKEKRCLNSTQYPYYASQLEFIDKNKYPITNNHFQIDSANQAEFLNSYQKSFREQIGASSNIEDSNFAELYFDSSGNLKAHCGFYNMPNSEESQFIIGNNSAAEVSYCTSKSECQLDSTYVWDNSSGNDIQNLGSIPICKNEDGKYYWSGSIGSQTGSKTKLKAALIPKNSTNSTNSCNASINTCLEVGKNIYGWNDVTIEQNQCVFTLDCDNAILDIDGTNVNWSNLSEHIKAKQGGVPFFENEDPNPRNRILQNCSGEGRSCMNDPNNNCKGDVNGYPANYTLSNLKKNPGGTCSVPSPNTDFKINPDGRYCYNGYDYYKNKCIE